MSTALRFVCQGQAPGTLWHQSAAAVSSIQHAVSALRQALQYPSFVQGRGSVADIVIARAGSATCSGFDKLPLFSRRGVACKASRMQRSCVFIQLTLRQTSPVHLDSQKLAASSVAGGKSRTMSWHSPSQKHCLHSKNLAASSGVDGTLRLMPWHSPSQKHCLWLTASCGALPWAAMTLCAHWPGRWHRSTAAPVGRPMHHSKPCCCTVDD